MFKIPGAIIQDEDEYLRNQQEQYQNLPRIGKRNNLPFKYIWMYLCQILAIFFIYIL